MTSAPRAVGRKAMAAALSDLAAMGASQGEAYVVVAAPDELSDEDLLGIADGLAEMATREGVSIAGGDLVGCPVLVVSVTAVGYEPGGSRFVTRAGARPRDLVAVTGELGGAAAAVELIDAGERRGEAPDRGAGLLERQLNPVPRLREGRALAAAGATAMIDISDGLGADAGHLARAERLPARDRPRSGARGRRGRGGCRGRRRRARAGCLGRRGLRAARHPAARALRRRRSGRRRRPARS